MGRDDTLSKIIENIYACASAPEGWPDVLAEVGAFTNARCGHLLIFEGSKQPPRLSIVGGVDPASGRDYDQHYASRDPRMPGFLRTINKVAACHQLVDPDEFSRSEIVNDFLLKWDARYCMVGGFPIEGGLHGIWSAMRGRNGGFFQDDEIKRLSLLLPHIRQSIALQVRLGFLGDLTCGLQQALNLLASPAFVIDSNCRLYFVNQAGDEALRAGTQLRLRDGRIRGSRPSATVELEKEIARVVASGRTVSDSSEMILTDEKEPPAILSLCPLRGHAAQGFLPRAEIVMFLIRVQDHRPSSSMLLRTAFGLSSGEADLALRLAAGERLQEIADLKRVSIETIRSQLKSIFLKTNTRRQSDVIRLIQVQTSVALR